MLLSHNGSSLPLIRTVGLATRTLTLTSPDSWPVIRNLICAIPEALPVIVKVLPLRVEVAAFLFVDWILRVEASVNVTDAV